MTPELRPCVLAPASADALKNLIAHRGIGLVAAAIRTDEETIARAACGEPFPLEIGERLMRWWKEHVEM